ncbi:MAG TPA: asparagine synthase (glutamine-hydrolyzing) [Flavipsychrobacter sp.]
MCGISGIVARDAERYKPLQEKMVSCQAHRGPDGNGIYSFSNCLLGHNRLSIIDLVSGDQPMLNEQKNIGIAFNGEIYGFQSIREKLEYNFRTTSDTEVILAMYEKYGTGLLPRLPGMFAFGLWDDRKQLFFAARDRFGEKPFYYSLTTGNELVFASELKAIVVSGLVSTDIDPAAVSRYLTHGYIGPVQTIYKNIYSLPPAHSLTFRDGELRIERYWNFPATTTENISLSDAADKFEHLFEEAVRKQMVADVEVSAFLSGGLDSTSVVKAATKFNPAINTLAFGYKDKFNELPFAKAAADMYGTNHHELLEEGSDIEELFLMLPDIYDEPFSDSSAIPTYLICKAARKFGKVVLTGDGGDELLGGYTWWYKPILESIISDDRSKVSPGYVFAMAAVEKMREKIPGAGASRRWRNKLNNIKGSNAGDIVAAAAANHSFDKRIIDSLGLPSPAGFIPFWQQDNSINDAMKFDIADYMPGNILVKTDRAAMANNLELRAPFLDVEFAEFCISMPGHFKTDGKADKILLREAMGKYWPDTIKCRDKQGFGVSGEYWKDSPKMKRLYSEFVTNDKSKLYDLLPYKETQKVIAATPGIAFNFLILSIWMSKKYS